MIVNVVQRNAYIVHALRTPIARAKRGKKGGVFSNVSFSRSRIMSSIRGKNNKSTELKLIDIFKRLNIAGWRRRYKLFGNPDFVFLILA